MKTSIQILGMREHSKTQHLLVNVRLALVMLEIDIEPTQIIDMDEFMRHKLSGIPALIVNDKVVSQKKVLTVLELTQLFQLVFMQQA